MGTLGPEYDRDDDVEDGEADDIDVLSVLDPSSPSGRERQAARLRLSYQLLGPKLLRYVLTSSPRVTFRRLLSELQGTGRLRRPCIWREG